MCIAFSVPNDKMYPLPTYFEILSLQIIDRESYSCGPSNSFVPRSKFFSVFGSFFQNSQAGTVSKKGHSSILLLQSSTFFAVRKVFQFHM